MFQLCVCIVYRSVFLGKALLTDNLIQNMFCHYWIGMYALYYVISLQEQLVCMVGPDMSIPGNNVYMSVDVYMSSLHVW